MSLIKPVVRNTAVLIFGQIAGALLSFTSSIFLVRALGSIGYGKYAVIYAFLTLFTWAVSGTDNIIVREAAKSPQNSDDIWSSGILTQVVLSIPSFILVAIMAVAMRYSPNMIMLILLASIETVLLAPWRFAARVFQVELQQWRGVVAILVKQLSWILFLLVFSFYQVPMLTLLLIRTVTSVLEVLITWWLVRPFMQFHWKLDRSQFMYLIRVSWPLALNALSVAVYYRIDQVLIERFLNLQELGYYAVAVNLTSVLHLVPLAFMSSIYPLLCRQESSVGFEYIKNISFRWILMFAVGIAGILTILGQTIIVGIYGSGFAASGRIFDILIWSEVAVCYSIVMAQVLLARNLQSYVTIATTIGAVVNFLGNIYILPRFGLIGSSWVTVCSYSLSSIFIFLFFNPTRIESWSGVIILLKLILIGLAGLILSTFLANNILMAVAIFLIIFGSSVWVGKIITNSDLKLLLHVFSGG